MSTDENGRSYLDRLVGKAKRGDFFVDAGEVQKQYAPPVKDQKNAVRHDKLDELAWAQIRDRVSALDKQVESATEKHATAGEAYEDLFNLLNQGDPRFTDVAKMQDEYLPQHALAQNLHESEEFKYIRRETRFDEYNTALAMLTMKDRMDKSLDQIEEQVEAIRQAAQALAEAIAAAEEALANGASLEEATEGLIAAMGGSATAEAQGQEAAEAVKAMMEKALAEARAAIDKERQAMAGYGIGAGELQRMPFDKRRQLAERFEPERMKRLAALIGRFRQSADAERRRKVTAVPSERYDVILGNDLNLLVASEMEALVIPELEEHFWLRWQQHGLAQYEVRGIERSGKGPIMVVCDESGSMGAQLDNEGNTREEWSKAVALALCDQALRDKRDFIYIGFASGGQVWQIEFKGGVTDYEKVLDFVSHFYCGGTEYEPPLTRAAAVIKEYGEKGNKMPDVVMITDDSCRVGAPFIEWWNQMREQYDVTMYGLQIGGEPWQNNLKDLSDRCMNIDSLNANPQGVTELFRQI